MSLIRSVLTTTELKTRSRKISDNNFGHLWICSAFAKIVCLDHGIIVWTFCGYSRSVHQNQNVIYSHFSFVRLYYQYRVCPKIVVCVLARYFFEPIQLFERTN